MLGNVWKIKSIYSLFDVSCTMRPMWCFFWFATQSLSLRSHIVVNCAESGSCCQTFQGFPEVVRAVAYVELEPALMMHSERRTAAFHLGAVHTTARPRQLFSRRSASAVLAPTRRGQKHLCFLFSFSLSSCEIWVHLCCFSQSIWYKKSLVLFFFSIVFKLVS